jgi:hypothetical protein
VLDQCIESSITHRLFSFRRVICDCFRPQAVPYCEDLNSKIEYNWHNNSPRKTKARGNICNWKRQFPSCLFLLFTKSLHFSHSCFLFFFKSTIRKGVYYFVHLSEFKVIHLNPLWLKPLFFRVSQLSAC